MVLIAHFGLRGPIRGYRTRDPRCPAIMADVWTQHIFIIWIYIITTDLLSITCAMLYDAQWCCKPRMTSRGRPGVPYQGSPIPSHLGRCPGSTYNDNPDRYHPLSMIYILNATRKSCYSYGTTCNLQGTTRGRHPMDFSYHLIQKVSIS